MAVVTCFNGETSGIINYGTRNVSQYFINSIITRKSMNTKDGRNSLVLKCLILKIYSRSIKRETQNIL